jgi:hypothetical protein
LRVQVPAEKEGKEQARDFNKRTHMLGFKGLQGAGLEVSNTEPKFKQRVDDVR